MANLTLKQHLARARSFRTKAGFVRTPEQCRKAQAAAVAARLRKKAEKS